GTVAPGNSIGTITINGNYNYVQNEQTGSIDAEFTGDGNYVQSGSIDAEFTGDGTSDKIIVSGRANVGGTINLIPIGGYFSGNHATSLQIVENAGQNNSLINDTATYNIIENNPLLNFRVDRVSNEQHTDFSVTADRDLAVYSSIGQDAVTNGIARAFAANADNAEGNAADLVGAVEFSGSLDDIAANMRKLNPSLYSSSAQTVLDSHSLLNSFIAGGSLKLQEKPAANVNNNSFQENEPNTWRSMVMPFSSYTDQHRGSRGYTSHNSGVLGVMERTLDNGFIHGYHAVLNHLSTREDGSSNKGEGFYFGAQAKYAPAEWNGWQLFGSARLGLEQMRSHRSVYIPGINGGYSGKADADWTEYSGSLQVGTAWEKEHGSVKSGPFAAVDYSFVHRPGVSESGDAIRTRLTSETYNSLRTQLGYRLTTKPKALKSGAASQWQAHASAAWNHELLSNNGHTNYQLTELPGVTISDTAENYGRDSLSVMAGLTISTPKNLEVNLSIGGNIYHQGSSSVYGKAELEWKF
ncbi:MAG: autotransporter outer membrane beta-barrel domain-containing protein, partial [bacterium]